MDDRERDDEKAYQEPEVESAGAEDDPAVTAAGDSPPDGAPDA
jgi:hypothetical protein